MLKVILRNVQIYIRALLHINSFDLFALLHFWQNTSALIQCIEFIEVQKVTAL